MIFQKKRQKKRVLSGIPHYALYEEGGMIETERGIFTAGFILTESPADPMQSHNNRLLLQSAVMRLLSGLCDFTFEVTVFNSPVPMEDYLAGLKLPDNNGFPEISEAYLHVIRENANIGHNNFARHIYLTLACKAGSPDDALIQFQAAEEDATAALADHPLLVFVRMTLSERMELLDQITADVFRENPALRDHLMVGERYARSFFINSIPPRVSETMLTDFSNVSAASILSVTCIPFEAEQLAASRRTVRSNTNTKEIPLRETVADRRAHAFLREEEAIREDDADYFSREALSAFTEACAKEETLYLCSFTVCLMADDMDELDRISALLKLAAGKYAANIKTLDFQQRQGLLAVLPLCLSSVQTGRVLPADMLCKLLPFSFGLSFQQRPYLAWLNAINDTLLFDGEEAGSVSLIIGADHSGKTFAAKRAAAGVLLTSEAQTFVVTAKPEEWRRLSDCFGGMALSFLRGDIFDKDPDYALSGNIATFRSLFLEAYLSFSPDIFRRRMPEEERQGVKEQITKEASLLCGCSSFFEAAAVVAQYPGDFPIYGAMQADAYPTDAVGEWLNAAGGSRLVLLSPQTPMELLLVLDALIRRRKENREIAIIVDGIDAFCFSSAASDYLLFWVDCLEKLKIRTSLVLQDAVHIVSDTDACIELDYLLAKVPSYKLLSLGPVERKHLMERLSIPEALTPYISDRPPGEGVLLSPSANIPFTDRFAEEGDAFYGLFA